MVRQIQCQLRFTGSTGKFGQESCPAGEYLHSEQLWMIEKASAALKTTPTTIPLPSHKLHTFPKIHKKKKYLEKRIY